MKFMKKFFSHMCVHVCMCIIMYSWRAAVALCGQQFDGCLVPVNNLVGYECKMGLKLILDKIFYKL